MEQQTKTRAARLTVVEHVYYQPREGGPTQVSSRFARPCEEDEQSFSRFFNVGEEWVPLELAWIERAGQIALANTEGKFTLIPSSEERREVEGRVIEVGAWDFLATRIAPFLLIRPGESARFEPADAKHIRLRCRRGEARVKVDAFPQ